LITSVMYSGKKTDSKPKAILWKINPRNRRIAFVQLGSRRKSFLRLYTAVAKTLDTFCGKIIQKPPNKCHNAVNLPQNLTVRKTQNTSYTRGIFCSIKNRVSRLCCSSCWC
jgi:hypothetical protein